MLRGLQRFADQRQSALGQVGSIEALRRLDRCMADTDPARMEAGLDAFGHIAGAAQGMLERGRVGGADHRIPGRAVEMGEEQADSGGPVMEARPERAPTELLGAVELVVNRAEPVAARAVPDGVAHQPRADLERRADARLAQVRT